MARISYEPVADKFRLRTDDTPPDFFMQVGSLWECAGNRFEEVRKSFGEYFSLSLHALCDTAEKRSCTSLLQVVPIVLSGEVRVPMNRIGSDVFNEICGQLTLDNPAFKQAKRFSRYSTSKVPRTLEFYRFGSFLTVPRGFLPALVSLLQPMPAVVFDRTISVPVECESQVQLYDYQQPLVEAAVEAGYGIISSPPGSGKTVVGMEIIARHKQQTLWVIDSKELVDQTFKRAEQFLVLEDGDLAVYGGGKRNVGRLLTVATLQTLHRDLGAVDNELSNRFGLVIQDEAHITPAATYWSVLSKLNARYKFGLTATPYRTDGLTEVMFWTLGPLLSKISARKLEEAGRVMIPEVKVVTTQFYATSQDFATLMKGLVNDHERSKLVVDTLLKERVYTLVLSARVAYCKALHALCEEQAPGSSVVLVGSLSKGSREEALRLINDKEVEIVFATTALAAEGLDIPHLERLALVTPTKARRLLEQAIGRVMRVTPGKKKPQVLDFADLDVTMLSNQFTARARLYRSLDMSISYE